MSADHPVTSELSVIDRWRDAWPQALAVWSRYTRLSDPQLCESRVQAAGEGLSGSFAMIRLADQSVVVDLEGVASLGLEDYGVEVLAHEIGHHVYAPANATDHYRLLARIRRGLPTLERHAAMVANLYTDLLINDRLQRQSELRMAEIYRRLHADDRRRHPATTGNPGKPGVWMFYMSVYEHLWQLDPGSLGGATGRSRVGTDAWLGARLIRAYANDWLDAGGRFATLVLPYLVEDDAASQRMLARLQDTKEAAAGCEPSGLTEIDDDELGSAIHPAEDPRVTGEEAPTDARSPETAALPNASSGHGRGQRREPFEYGEILKSAGVKLDDHAIAVRYYRESALPYLVAFPKRPAPQSEEPLVEGYEAWDMGDALDEIDWIGTVTQSPTVFPGVTTVRRQFGRVEGQTPAMTPIDLDLYVDCSGSMPNPQQQVSYLALAGAVIVLSALRAGARVQATLWSGKHQVISTAGFVRHEDEILRVLTGYLGGGTAFPVHKLRDTYAKRAATDRACHILMISDDGITTMFDDDERGSSGWDIAAHALAVGRAGGTMALNIDARWDRPESATQWWSPATLRRARDIQGWDIHAIAQIEDLVAFARAFSHRRYGAQATAGLEQGR